MFSKRFMTWVGVGVLSVATIPAFAAPHLARLAARHPVTKTHSHNKTTPAATKLAAHKPAAKPAAKAGARAKAAPLAHVPAKAAAKKATTPRTTKLAAVTYKPAPARKHLTAGHKVSKAATHRTLAAAHKAIIH
jgi:hypothetical protein